MQTGDCLNDNEYSIITFDVRVDGDNISILLPEAQELDAVLGTNKWMVRQATAELYDRGSGGGVEIVGPHGEDLAAGAGGCGSSSSASVPGCTDSKLEW